MKGTIEIPASLGEYLLDLLKKRRHELADEEERLLEAPVDLAFATQVKQSVLQLGRAQGANDQRIRIVEVALGLARAREKR